MLGDGAMTGGNLSAEAAPGIKGEKNRIREEMLKRRLSVSENAKSVADAAMVQKLLSLASFRYANTILFYYPIKGEPNLTAAVSTVLALGKRAAFPKCRPDGSKMVYKLVTSLDELSSAMYGIPEPPDENESYIPSRFLNDICIVPAVCFDRHGYRIGYGKGYYDRFLADFGGTSVGFTLDCLLKDIVPRGRYDRAVDMIITEKGAFVPK